MRSRSRVYVHTRDRVAEKIRKKTETGQESLDKEGQRRKITFRLQRKRENK